MTHIVTRLCLRDTACVEVCPVECMVLGQPETECPYEAIFPEEEVPFDFVATTGLWVVGTAAMIPDGQKLENAAVGEHTVNVLNAKQLAGGEVLDLTEDIEANYDFFADGPGYDALD